MPGQTLRAATVGVAENSNLAVLVTVARGGELLDRRRIHLTDRGLPTHPHHHEGSWAVGRYLNIPGARALTLAEAVALVERVRASAARGARKALDALAVAVPVPIASIAIRACPELPATIEERIADNRAQTIADSVMYREALATAAVGLAELVAVRHARGEALDILTAERLRRVTKHTFAVIPMHGPPARLR